MFIIVVYSFGVLSYFSFILDQCCSTNGLPDECLGLCMEDEDTSIAERSAFTSICDKYQSTVVKCTVEGGGIRFNWDISNSLLIKLLCAPIPAYWYLIFLLDTCTCSTPSAGTAEHNEFTCTNGESAYCQADEECYATGEFNYGQLSSACRKPAGTSNESVDGCQNMRLFIY